MIALRVPFWPKFSTGKTLRCLKRLKVRLRQYFEGLKVGWREMKEGKKAGEMGESEGGGGAIEGDRRT